MNTIQLGGKAWPVRYSHKALRMLSAALGAKTFTELGEKVADIGVDDVATLTQIGVSEGCRHTGQAFEHTIDEVGEWLDDEPAGIFQTVLEIFMEDFSAGQGEKKGKAGSIKPVKAK